MLQNLRGIRTVRRGGGTTRPNGPFPLRPLINDSGLGAPLRSPQPHPSLASPEGGPPLGVGPRGLRPHRWGRGQPSEGRGRCARGGRPAACQSSAWAPPPRGPAAPGPARTAARREPPPAAAPPPSRTHAPRDREMVNATYNLGILHKTIEEGIRLKKNTQLPASLSVPGSPNAPVRRGRPRGPKSGTTRRP